MGPFPPGEGLARQMKETATGSYPFLEMNVSPYLRNQESPPHTHTMCGGSSGATDMAKAHTGDNGTLSQL